MQNIRFHAANFCLQVCTLKFHTTFEWLLENLRFSLEWNAHVGNVIIQRVNIQTCEIFNIAHVINVKSNELSPPFTRSQRDLKFHFNLMLWNDSYPNTLTSCRNCFTPLSSLAVPRRYRKKNSCIIHTISAFSVSYRSRPTVGGSMILWDRVSLLKNRRHDNLRKLSSAFDNRVRYRHAWYIPREIVAHRVPLKFNRTNHIPQGGKE